MQDLMLKMMSNSGTDSTDILERIRIKDPGALTFVSPIPLKGIQLGNFLYFQRSALRRRGRRERYRYWVAPIPFHGKISRF